MTATAGTGLRGTYKIHLTNAGKNIRQVRPFRKLLLNRFNRAETNKILIHVSSKFSEENSENVLKVHLLAVTSSHSVVRRRIGVLDNKKSGGCRALGPRSTSNLQHTMASNVDVSSRRLSRAIGAIFVVSTMSVVSATPVDSGMNIPVPAARYVPAQLSGNTPRTIAANPGRTFDRLGPQATERAVRSSLKTALVPDPLAMGALIFCAFALRWISRRQQVTGRHSPANEAPAVPRAA